MAGRGIGCSEARDRGLQVAVKFEYRIQLGHLEQLADLRTRVEELGLAAFLLRLGQRAHESAQSRAVEEADVGEIDEEIHPPLLEERGHGLLEGGLGLPDDEVAGHREYGD